MSGEGAGESYQDAFARIEAAVRAGESDVRALGFWRLLSRVKAEPALAAHWADVAGRIDRAAFEAGVRPRYPVWIGNGVLLLGTALGVGAIGVAIRTKSEALAGLALVFAAAAWSICLHDLAHWMSGRVVGIRFIAYFVGGPFPPRPGLKIDYATYLRTAPAHRAWMHASGAIATKLAPFAALAFWPATDAPAWSAVATTALGLLMVVTDVLVSTKRSDWKKVRRELRLARVVALGG